MTVNKQIMRYTNMLYHLTLTKMNHLVKALWLFNITMHYYFMNVIWDMVVL